MKRIFICLSVVLLHVASPGAADPISIRSGEHEQYSRLVFSIEDEADWSLQKIENGYQLAFEGSVSGFDTSNVLDRLPRRRLTSLTQPDPSRLEIALNCVCHATAFLWRDDRLVIDIKDGAPPFDESASSSTDAAEINLTANPQSRPAPQRAPHLLSNLGEEEPLAAPLPLPNADENAADLLDGAEATLVENVARATTHGILTPALPDFPSEPTQPSAPEESNNSPVTHTPSETEVIYPGVGLSSTSLEALANLRSQMSAIGASPCLPLDDLDIKAWGDERPFHAQIAELSMSLVADFGQEAPDYSEQMARILLFFGFGSEALSLLNKEETRSKSQAILTELATLIDGYPGSHELLLSQIDCETPGALWAFLAMETPHSPDHRNMILREFLLLPPDLRRHLSPRLSQQFLRVQDIEAAEQISLAGLDPTGTGAPTAQMTRAMISEAGGQTAQALSILTQEVEETAHIPPEALISLIDLSLDEGQQPETSHLDLAAALRQEYAGTELASDLAFSEARARLAAGEYRDALELVPQIDAERSETLTNNIYKRIAADSSERDFLEFVFSDIPGQVKPETQNALARRLIDLGFFERATTILSGPAQRADASERRYLRAEAALGSEDYGTVLEMLVGLTDDRARALQARAHRALGQHAEALSALGSEDESSLFAFRAAAWNQLSTNSDDALSTFAESVISPSSSLESTPLAQRRAILDASEHSRQAVESLLSRFDLDDLE